VENITFYKPWATNASRNAFILYTVLHFNSMQQTFYRQVVSLVATKLRPTPLLLRAPSFIIFKTAVFSGEMQYQCFGRTYCRGLHHTKPAEWFFFDVLLTVHLSIFVSVINQPDSQTFCFTISLFHASTCFEHMCSSSGGQNCITQPLVSLQL